MKIKISVFLLCILFKNTLLYSMERDNAQKLGFALLQAASEGKTDEVKTLLVRGADIEYKQNGSDLVCTALQFAVIHGRTETVKLLLKKGACIPPEINEHVVHLTSPLKIAAADNSFEILEMLLERSDVSKDYSLLPFAVNHAQPKSIIQLLKHGAPVKSFQSLLTSVNTMKSKSNKEEQQEFDEILNKYRETL